MSEKICDICCTKFNRSNQKETNCNFCNSTACLSCIKKYLLDTNGDYHCMFCRNKWNRSILVEKLPQSFIKNELREHEEERIVNMEKARLPEAQTIAERRIQLARAREIEKIKYSMDEFKNNEYKLELLKMLAKNCNLNLDEPIKTIDSEEQSKEEKKQYIRNCPNSNCHGFINDKWTCGLCTTKICKTCFDEIRPDDKHHCDPNTIESNKLIMKDTKPCPKCNSMIHKLSGCFAMNTPILMWNGTTKFSQDIQIGDEVVGDDLKKRKVLDICSGEDELYLIRQLNAMDYIVNSKHELVVKDLGNQIYHITPKEYIDSNKLYFGFDVNGQLCNIYVEPMGIGKYYGWLLDENHRFLLRDFTVVKNCDQMYCTICHTAFSWTKGTIEKGPIHNPHYYQWKQLNATPDENNACNENLYPSANSVITSARITDSMISKKWMPIFHQYFVHIDHVVRPTHEQIVARDEKMDINVEYMMGKISKTEWKRRLYSCDKRQEMSRDILDLIEMVITVSGERFRKFIENQHSTNVIELNNLIDYIENELEMIRKRFLVKNVIIPEQSWNIERKNDFKN